MAKKELYHVMDDFQSGRHWIVIARSEAEARQKVIKEVPDLPKCVLKNPTERLDVVMANEGMTEIEARINIQW